MRAANSEANASRISYVEQCFGSAGQVCEFNFLFFLSLSFQVYQQLLYFSPE